MVGSDTMTAFEYQQNITPLTEFDLLDASVGAMLHEEIIPGRGLHLDPQRGQQLDRPAAAAAGSVRIQ